MSVFSFKSKLYLLETHDGPVRRFDVESGKRLVDDDDPRHEGLRLNVFNIPPMTQDDLYKFEDGGGVASHETDGMLEVRRRPGHDGSEVVNLIRKADDARTIGVLVPCEDGDEDEDDEYKKNVVAFLMNDAKVPVPCWISRSEWVILRDLDPDGEIKRDESVFVLEHSEGYVYPSNGPKTKEDLLKIYMDETGIAYGNDLVNFIAMDRMLTSAYKHMIKHPDSVEEFFVGDTVSFKLCKDGDEFVGRLCDGGRISFSFHLFCVCQTTIAVDLFKTQ